MLRVTALYVYPVKSCRGLAVNSAVVDARGFAGDRRFMVVDAQGQFLTQRAHPRMALIETALTAGNLTLSCPNHGSVSVSLSGFRSPVSGIDSPVSALRSPVSSVSVWKDMVTADDCGDAPAQWLGDFLGLSCRLVRAGRAYSRPIPRRKIPAGLDVPGDSPHEVSFADAFPFLVISEESLANLNARLDSPLPMDRFRPNLVVAGGAPYSEDTWSRFRIGEVVFHGATRCGRCVVTTTDQRTAERAQEPLRTLATYRCDAEGTVMFGRNLIHETKAGRVSVGDAVELL
jgi:uncharacterized protein YcbX